MELTLDSAFSVGGMDGHLAYVFQVLSMLMRSIVALRILFVVNVLLNIFYVTVWVHDPVRLFWESLLFVINIGQLALIWWQIWPAQFSDDEKVFAASRLRGLSRGQTRQLLTLEGERPLHLTSIASGNAGTDIVDRRIADCGSGHYIGEMSVLDREPASAMDQLSERKPAVVAVLEAGIARDMCSKLMNTNASRAANQA